MTFAYLQSQYASLFVNGLIHAGVQDIVISPGSRSTALVIAASQSSLTCHSIIDERSAAFFALGQAKTTQTPTVLLCTSGTAGAHYLPAVLEASYSFTPLIIVTADHPFENHHAGMPQTIEQSNLYGAHVRWTCNIPVADANPDALKAIQYNGAQAVHISKHPTPGPVHINIAFRKPLEPDQTTDAKLTSLVETLYKQPLPKPIVYKTSPDTNNLNVLYETIRSSNQGLIVCGPQPIAQKQLRASLWRFAQATGFPVFAEATSQFRFCEKPNNITLCHSFDALVRSKIFQTQKIGCIIQLGSAPVSTGYRNWHRQQSQTIHYGLSPYGWHTPHHQATQLFRCDIASVIDPISDRLAQTPVDDSMRKPWRDFIGQSDPICAETLNDASLCDVTIAQIVINNIPRNTILALGNSLPIRAIDMANTQNTFDVWSQRGVNGIDGLVAGAAGAASKSNVPVVLLVGDVSFLHDLTALMTTKELSTPYCIVVIDNQGGRIFEHLPIATALKNDKHLWLTNPNINLNHVGKLFDIPYTYVDNQQNLHKNLKKHLQQAGCSIIHAKVSTNTSPIYTQIQEAVENLQPY